MSSRPWPLLAVVAVLAVACTTPTTKADEHLQFPKPPSYDELVRRAALDPCPSTASTTPTSMSPSLPDITLPCLGRGPQVRLSALRGTPLLVNIWATWCGPCQKETGYLSQVYDSVKGRVRFLGVDTEDDTKSALDFAPHVTPPMRYPQLVDTDKRLMLALHLQAVPATLFVDAAGRLVHVTRDYYRTAAALRADLAHYLGVQA